jgi:hypothetical protein
MILKDVTGDHPLVPMCPKCKTVPLFADVRYHMTKKQVNFLYCKKCLHVYMYVHEI